MNMALMAKVLPVENGIKHSISKILGSEFSPCKAMYFLSDWIHQRVLPSNLSTSNPNDAEKITAVYKELMAELNNLLENSRDPFARYTLWSAQQKFKGQSPAVVYQFLMEGIEMRRPINKAAQSGFQFIDSSYLTSETANGEVAFLAFKSLELQRRTNELAFLLRNFKLQVQDERNVGQQINSSETVKGWVSSPNIPKYKLTTALDALELNVYNKRQQLETCLSEYSIYIGDIVTECRLLVQKVVGKLMPILRWHSWESNDTIPLMTDVQHWYSKLIDICFELKRSIATIQQNNTPWNFQSLWFDQITGSFHELTNCHSALLANPVAMSSQPADTVRTTKFESIQVQVLCGNKLLALKTMPLMKVILINENQAKRVYEFGFPCGIMNGKMDGKQEPYESCGTLIGNTADCSTTGTWAFQKLSLKSVKRKEPSRSHSVLEEKFCFLVYATTPLEHNKTWWCCSRPFFVTVNNNQNSKVTALAFIEESFRVRNRKPFDVPQSVPCSRVITALEKYFLKRTNSKRGFTSTNKAFLRSKLLKHMETEYDPPVILERLNEYMEGCSFTFFNWFIGIIVVVNSHLKGYWDDGLIVGFISQIKTEELLTRVGHDGEFMVRFSESKLSSVTLCYVLEINDDKRITSSLTALTCETFKSLSLPEILQGHIYHGQTKRDFTRVYFHELSEGVETLKCKHKYFAFPPLLNKEKSESLNRAGYVKCELVLAAESPKEEQNTETV